MLSQRPKTFKFCTKLFTSRLTYVVLIIFIVFIRIKSFFYTIGVDVNSSTHVNNIKEPWPEWGIDQSPMFYCNNNKQQFKHCGERLSLITTRSKKEGSLYKCDRSSVDVVISHFSRPVMSIVKSIISSTPTCKRHPLRFFIYSKGIFPYHEKLELEDIVHQNNNIEKYNEIEIHFIFNLSNVGRCDHTYLYHITQHYRVDGVKGFADLTLFVKDTTAWHIHLDVQSNVLSMLSLNFNPLSNEDDESSLIAWCPREVGIASSKFQLKEYKSEQCSRFGRCYDTELGYIRASIRPLDNWIYHMNIVNQSMSDSRSIHQPGKQSVLRQKNNLKKYSKLEINACLGGVFAVTSHGIRHSSLETYVKLLHEMSFADSLEAGHYMERSWFLTFGIVSNKGNEVNDVMNDVMNKHYEKEVDMFTQNTLYQSTKLIHKNQIGIILILNQISDFENIKNCYKLPEVLKSKHLNILYFVVFKERQLSSYPSSLFKAGSWHEIVVESWETAVISPHLLTNDLDFIYTIDHSQGNALLNGFRYNLYTMTTSDIRISIGRSLVNGAGISFPVTNSTSKKHCDWSICWLEGNCDETCQPITRRDIRQSMSDDMYEFSPMMTVRRMTESVNVFNENWYSNYRRMSKAESSDLRLLKSLHNTWLEQRNKVAPLFFEGGMLKVLSPLTLIT